MIEQLLAFLTTHLSIVALLMPWKQLVITDKTDTTVPAENLNYHLWDLVEKDKWFYKMSTDVVPVPVEDPSLCTISMVFLVFCIMSLLLTITGYGMRTFFPTTDPNIASIVDFSSWGVAMCLFLTMVSTQGDFDTSWAFEYRSGLNLPVKADTDKMFFPLGIVIINCAVLSYFVINDVRDRWKR